MSKQKETPDGVVCGRPLTEKEQARLEVFRRVERRELTQSEAGEVLGISRVRFNVAYQRWKKGEGDEGVKSRRIGREPGNKKHRLREEFKDWYDKQGGKEAEYGPELARDEYEEDTGVSLSSMTVWRIMKESGEHVPKEEKPLRQHPLRDRHPRYGDMVQMDATPEEWMPGFTCNLIQVVDDATSTLMLAKFVETESLFAYLGALEDYMLAHGCPALLLTDKHAVFRHSGHVEGHRTRFVIVLNQLGMDIVYSSSPQSRGRVERARLTAQKRLVKLLRRHVYPKVKDFLDDRPRVMRAMNDFLRDVYIPMHNRKFAVAADEDGDSHRQLDEEEIESLPLLMCRVTDVRMCSNGMVRYENEYYKTEKANAINIYARRAKPTIRIYHHHEGNIRFFHQDREIKMVVTKKAMKKDPPVVTSKDLNETHRTKAPPKPVKGTTPPNPTSGKRHPTIR